MAFRNTRPLTIFYFSKVSSILVEWEKVITNFCFRIWYEKCAICYNDILIQSIRCIDFIIPIMILPPLNLRCDILFFISTLLQLLYQQLVCISLASCACCVWGTIVTWWNPRLIIRYSCLTAKHAAFSLLKRLTNLLSDL